MNTLDAKLGDIFRAAFGTNVSLFDALCLLGVLALAILLTIGVLFLVGIFSVKRYTHIDLD